jgi:hypothetical protein
MPQRKKRCPSCKEFIYVKRRPSEKVKRLVTGAEADQIETEWGERQYIHKWAQQLRVQPGAILGRQVDLPPGASLHDAVWSLLVDAPPSFAKALFIHEDGQSSLSAKREFLKRRLEEDRRTGATRVEISSSGGCEHCQPLDGKRLSITQALKTMPVPCAECEWDLNESGSGWCRCLYIPCGPSSREFP